MHSPTYPLKLGLYKGVHVIYSSFMQKAAKSAHLLKNSLVNSQAHINQRIYNMATVLRVKRRREDDPFEAFVVSAKRARTESSVHAAACATDVEAMDTVFDFAGTVEKKDTPVGRHVSKAIRRTKSKYEFIHTSTHCTHPVDVKARMRVERKKNSAQARYKVIAQKRASALEGLDENPEVTGNKEEEAFHLLDLEMNQARLDHQREKDFVYDLYYVKDHKLSFQNLQECTFEGKRPCDYMDEPIDLEDKECPDYEYDSNDEYDYPDEECSSQRGRYDADLVDYEVEEEDYCNPFPCDDDAYYAQLLEDKLTMKERCDDEYRSPWDDDDDDGFAYNPDY